MPCLRQRGRSARTRLPRQALTRSACAFSRTRRLPTLKLSTQHGYKNVLRKHVLPYWDDWRLRDVGRADIQQWVAGKFRQGQGWQTVRNSWTLRSAILETATEYGYLSMNPARGVKFPPKGLKDAPSVIAGADFIMLLAHLREPYRTMLSLIAATGLRIGELLALRWRALDLERGTLAVRETVFEGKFGPPKTQKARRTIPLGPRAITAFQTHRQRSVRTGPDDLVFANRKGNPMTARCTRRQTV